jgi:predicted molibdopterin-dependent oxidoreductase YjgC
MSNVTVESTTATTTQVMTLDGEEVTFEAGETVYEVASRRSADIPTLCYDPRLEPLGSCRLCVVEIEGIRNPVASCTTQAEQGMVVQTATAAIEEHRRVLLEMVASENPQAKVEPLRGYASQELSLLVDRYAAATGRFEGEKSGTSNQADDNPFILRDYDQCISCYRCVRVCAEQEGDHAINIMNRGFHTLISTEFNGKLVDSACTFCGQCVQTCPTGALADRKAMRASTVVKPIKTRSICPYCGVGCSVDLLTDNDRIVGIHPAMDGPANEGALCVKGQYAFDFVHHRDRLKTPYVRDPDGSLKPASWDDALDKAADGFRKTFQRHGRHAIYGVASGRAPNEAAYMMQKFIRAGFGTHQIDNCSRA